MTVTTTADIPSGHKVALRSFAPDEPVRKYGEIIGYASAPIAPGDHVHEHNLEYRPVAREDEIPAPRPAPERPRATRTFLGYRRKNGKVGTRNYIGLLTTVNCSASVSKFIAAEIERRGILRDYPNIDGIVALTHTSGCAMPTAGEGFADPAAHDPGLLQPSRTSAGCCCSAWAARPTSSRGSWRTRASTCRSPTARS